VFAAAAIHSEIQVMPLPLRRTRHSQLVPWLHTGKAFLPKRTKEDAEGFRLFPTHERGSDAMERHQTHFWIRVNVSPEK